MRVSYFFHRLGVGASEWGAMYIYKIKCMGSLPPLRYERDDVMWWRRGRKYGKHIWCTWGSALYGGNRQLRQPLPGSWTTRWPIKATAWSWPVGWKEHWVIWSNNLAPRSAIGAERFWLQLAEVGNRSVTPRIGHLVAEWWNYSEPSL